MPFAISAGENHALGRIYIALGANQSYRGKAPLENLNYALGALETAGARPIALSRPWLTPAWPDPSDPPFINAAAEIEWGAGADALMALFHQVEIEFGRVRTDRNAPRSMDIDLIDFRGEVRQPPAAGDLALPHPRAANRAFVLLPLKDIAPDWRDPVSRASIDGLIRALPSADREACIPADGVLCAAAPGLMPRGA